MYVMDVVITVFVQDELVRYPDTFVCKSRDACIRRVDDLVNRYVRILKCPVGLEIVREYDDPDCCEDCGSGC